MKNDLYLRDLKDSLIADYLREWSKKRKTKLIKAFQDGKDIIVGEYNDLKIEITE